MCSTQLQYVNIILHVDICVLFTFAPPIIPLMYVPGHDLNSNASLKTDASLSFLHGCTWNIKIAYTINKISAKLISIHNIPLPHAHIIVYCNILNCGCCLSIDSVNLNKSRKVNILLLSKNHIHTFLINDIMSLDILLTLFTHSTSITLCTFVWDVSQTP